MKRKDLIKALKKAGFLFERHGRDHDVYIRGSKIEMIPRHKEINEALARTILRRNGIT